MPWYSSIGLFRHTLRNRNFIPQYEERTVLVRARTSAAARKMILAEFKRYAADAETEFLKEYTFDQVYDAPGSKVTEVSSLMRVSDLPARRYVDRYWVDLRPASCEKKGWKHAWRNGGDGISACYNCRLRRKGELWR
jgi:hypothetical protein